ncbi:MAG: DUF2298 domain-containing protein [Chloroflexota bacterium]|nr:DUF2298 domain-containing protein [Chloroflexota bacterium]
MTAQNKNLRWLFPLLVIGILLVAGQVRTFNLNWDKGTHLHPDERYLTMVSSALETPAQLSAYWDTATSPLNPENRGYKGYVYGTFPLFATRIVAQWLDVLCETQPVVATLLNAPIPYPLGHYVGYNGVHLVGRALSALVDLVTLVTLIWLATLLFDCRVALLSGALYAFAVLPIQHAHFFVVDNFATCGVMLTLALSVYAVESKRRWVLLLAGTTTGLAVATKISMWPVAGLVGLAGIMHQRRSPEGKSRYRLEITPGSVILLALSGLFALTIFRSTQPYAFAGPGFFNLSINPAWWESMRQASKLASGKIDVPFGHQWTRRAPILFPWLNMVFWGLGLPLGLTAWCSWAALGWRTFRRLDWRPLLPWLWGTLFFLYQSTQWVKSMRYLLPVYPVFVLFAAWGLFYGREKARSLATKLGLWPRRLVAGLGVLLPWLVLVGTVLWASAFLHIYEQPFTRIEASSWMYAHVPTAATLHTEAGQQIQLPLTPDSPLNPKGGSLSIPREIETASTITHLTLNKVTGNNLLGQRQFKVVVSTDYEGVQILTSGSVTANFESAAPQAVTIPLTPVKLESAQVIWVQIMLLDGPAVLLKTSALGNEHWDDSLPARISGKDPFGNWYQGLSSSPTSKMNLYDEDTPEKRAQLLGWLDEVDYLVLSSNRLYASIPRLAQRFPLTVAYYQALFDGSLGFELRAEFLSYPTLGPCQFPDQEIPFALPPARYTNRRSCSIPFPPAEEAFSVYDHPQVFIFAKTPAYTHQRAATLLPTSLLDNVQRVTPREATPGLFGILKRGKDETEAPSLLLETPRLAEQAAGGTWSKLFSRDAWQNRSQVVAVLLWWVLLSWLGWVAFPWLTLIFPALRLHGYGLARIVGLLCWAYAAWILASLHLLPATRATLWGLLVLFSLATAWLVRSRRAELTEFIVAHWRELLRIEALFAALYAAWVLVRYLNPDLYHPVAGGEKPMDFAYLNAVIKSTWFPPYDPWFSGGKMNYYYFGFVLSGSLIEALGIIPSVAYNLVIPSLFALTGIGGYTLAMNLAHGSSRRAHRAGLWGLLFTVVLGNLGELQLILKGFAEVGAISFNSLIPGYPQLVSTLVGFWKVLVTNAQLSFRPEWWYWNASRVIELQPDEFVSPINEFPAFTFLYADLHAHAMALPLTQIALALALQWASSPLKQFSAGDWPAKLRSWLPHPLGAFFLAALTAGALRATNTWDYPTYLGLMSVGYLLPLLRIPPAGEAAPETTAAWWRRVPWSRLLLPVALFLTAEVLFQPYIANYATAYTEIEAWKGSHTSLGAYFIMHGHFLLPLALLAVAEFSQLCHRAPEQEQEDYNVVWGTVIIGAALSIAVLTYLGVVIAWVAIPLGILSAVLLLSSTDSKWATLWLWIGSALALTIFVEIAVLKGDIGRMNTVFKFYLQVWTLLALAAAVAVEQILELLFWGNSAPLEAAKNPVWRRLVSKPLWGEVVVSVLGAMILATLLYPLLAIPAKTHDRWTMAAPHTLDGAAFIPYATQYENGGSASLAPDAGVIRWLQDNVAGSPVIIEGQATREYLWGNRVSVYTGLPGVAAWRWHQVQQRLVMPGSTVENRQQDIRDFYNTPNPDYARLILDKYGVRYVILTPYERLYMPPGVTADEVTPSESKFEALVAEGYLEVVYDKDRALIYRVTD